MVHAQRFANNRSGSTFGNQLKSTEATKGNDFWTQPKQNASKSVQPAIKSTTTSFTHTKSGSTAPNSSNNWGPFKNREDFVNMHHCWVHYWPALFRQFSKMWNSKLYSFGFENWREKKNWKKNMKSNRLNIYSTSKLCFILQMSIPWAIGSHTHTDVFFYFSEFPFDIRYGQMMPGIYLRLVH